MSEQPRDRDGRYSSYGDLRNPPSSAPLLPTKPKEKLWALNVQIRNSDDGAIIEETPVEMFATRNELEKVLLASVVEVSNAKNGRYVTGWISNPKHGSHLADPMMRHHIILMKQNPESKTN